MKLAPQIGQLAARTNGCIVQAHSEFPVAAARLKNNLSGGVPLLLDSREDILKRTLSPPSHEVLPD